MVRRMSAHEARANFGDLLGSVYYTREPVVVERKGKPMAVVISPEDFERFRALDAGRIEAVAAFAAFGERFKDVPDEEIEARVAEAVAEVRAEDRQRRSDGS